MKAFAAVAVTLTARFGLMAPAQAETGLYVNGGYTHYDDDVSLSAVTGRVGYRFTPSVGKVNFGMEGEASFGVKSDRVAGTKVELDHELGAYGVGFVPLTPKLDLFGRVGYAKEEYSSSTSGVPRGGDQAGVAFGGGAQYMFTPKFGVRGDYTRIEADNGIDALSASAVVKF